MVFGLLGLRMTESKWDVKPDYRKDATEVFADVLRDVDHNPDQSVTT
jgi:hypothetical protein